MTHWQDTPFRIEVKEGETKAYCMCRRTATPPFCDGSHGLCGVTPKFVTYEKDQKVAICGCGKTGNPPYCDGSHRK